MRLYLKHTIMSNIFHTNRLKYKKMDMPPFINDVAFFIIVFFLQ